MKTTLPSLLALLAGALIASALAAPAAESAAARLQQGLFEEEANQHYDAAIAAYQSVLATHEEERRLAATALFRLGECLRKLGRTNEATAHYQRLLHDFADQSALTRLAEQHLAALGMPRDTTLPAGKPPVLPADPARRSFIEGQIKITEAQLAETRQQAQIGLVHTNSELPVRQELARLRRELAATEEPPGGPGQQKWQREEIAIVEQKLVQARKLIGTGMAAKGSDRELEKELLGLQGNLRAMEAYAARPGEQAESTFAERLLEITQRAAGINGKREIERLQALIQESPDLVNTVKAGELPPLHNAVQKGELEVAAFLLSHGAEVDLKASDGTSPLVLAAVQGNKAMTELLLKHDARLDIRNSAGETPLIIAAASGFKAIVELLLAQGADLNALDNDRKSALHRAIASGRKEVVEVLLARNPKLSAPAPGANTPLHEAVFARSPGIARILLEKGAAVDDGRTEGQTPLVTAVLFNDETMVALLLKQKANPNARFRSEGLRDGGARNVPSVNVGVSGFTPLLLAAFLGYAPLVDLLRKAGADLNAQDAVGSTALIWASLRNNTETVRTLLEAGADPNLMARNSTPLGAAVRIGAEDIIRLLLEHKADPNLPEPGYTIPLISAVMANSDLSAPQLLLDHGADVNAAGASGETALDVAKGLASGVRAPARRVRGGFGRQPTSDTVSAAELVSFLREHGASEYAPRAGAITLCRVSRGATLTAFLKGTNDFNQHTLIEALLVAYANDEPLAPPTPLAPEPRSFPFPDLAKVRVSRRDPETHKVSESNIDVAAILSAADPAQDVPLKWGDVVEIPETDHREQDPWFGLSAPELAAITKILTRTVQIVVKGETHDVTIVPVGSPLVRGVPLSGRPLGGVMVSGGPVGGIPVGGTPGSGAFPAPTLNPNAVAPVAAPAPAPKLERNFGRSTFRLRAILDAANVLRVSSDLSRVRVKRVEPGTGKRSEWRLDYASPWPQPRSEFWLRNGDVIEVPDKS